MNTSDLKTYLDGLPHGEVIKFARRCGLTGANPSAYLYQLSRGIRRIPESLAIAFERESGGVVRAEISRPDVDWQYLRQSAKEVPQGARA